MRTDRNGNGMIAGRSEHDAVVVGASLAGCTAAILLARAGARVALVERRPDPAAFKRVCSHYIQSSAVPALKRLGLLDAIERAGGVRSRIRVWTRWGWIEVPAQSALPAGVNIRRERLDPLLREMAASTPGVELMLGRSVGELRFEGDRICGVVASDRGGARVHLDAPLVVGADGRDSRLAKLAGVSERTSRHGRFSYGAYYDGPPPTGSPNGTLWLTDPQMAAAFPTDDGLTMYAAMATKDRLPVFRRDPDAALRSLVAALPGAPPILESRQVGPVIGKIEMPNVQRGPVGPGLALVGDAALATDPLWGVGCGWAFQSGEWLADALAPALGGDEPLEAGLRRYGRRHRRSLGLHAAMIHDYATGRRFNAIERLLFSGAAHDRALAARMEAFATRNVGPQRLAAPGTLARAVVARGRRLGARRSNGVSPPGTRGGARPGSGWSRDRDRREPQAASGRW